MKKVITAGMVLLSAAMISCHSRPAPARLSCCEKEGTGTASGITTPYDASVYQLQGTWTDQHGRTLTLNELKGKVRIVAMVFTHCGYACPRIVQDMKAIEDSLPAQEKKEVGYVLVSFDVERDDPVQLARYAAWQGLDDRWTLLHGSAGQVRELSMLLNVRYQPTGDGSFSHTNTILILDRNGNIRRSLDGLGPQTNAAVNAIDEIVSR
jgi:protein SCO1/2